MGYQLLVYIYHSWTKNLKRSASILSFSKWQGQDKKHTIHLREKCLQTKENQNPKTVQIVLVFSCMIFTFNTQWTWKYVTNSSPKLNSKDMDGCLYDISDPYICWCYTHACLFNLILLSGVIRNQKLSLCSWAAILDNSMCWMRKYLMNLWH